MNGKGIRRKKSSLSGVKVAVIGAPGVGKSALSVRFLTRRYIGEYDHQGETRYKHEVLIDNEPILFEILDTCPKNENDIPTQENLNWADGLLLVYSITDRHSFAYIKRVGLLLTHCDVPVYLLANKNDMIHLRQVSSDEGAILARNLECGFSEVAAAEQVVPVASAFQELCRSVLLSRRKSKQSLLERMLGLKPIVLGYTPGARVIVFYLKTEQNENLGKCYRELDMTRNSEIFASKCSSSYNAYL